MTQECFCINLASSVLRRRPRPFPMLPPTSTVTAFLLAVAGGGGWSLREYISGGPQSPSTPSPGTTGSNCICEVSCPELPQLPPCICPSPVFEARQPQPWAAAVLLYLLSLVTAFLCGWYFGPRAPVLAAVVCQDGTSTQVPVDLRELANDPFDVPFLPASRKVRRRVSSA